MFLGFFALHVVCHDMSFLLIYLYIYIYLLLYICMFYLYIYIVHTYIYKYIIHIYMIDTYFSLLLFLSICIFFTLKLRQIGLILKSIYIHTVNPMKQYPSPHVHRCLPRRSLLLHMQSSRCRMLAARRTSLKDGGFLVVVPNLGALLRNLFLVHNRFF